MKVKSTLHSFLALSSTSFLVITCATAGQIWDGGGADDNWSTPANWDSDVLPNFATPISFAGDVRNGALNDLLADTIIGGFNLTNDGTDGFANAFILGGNRITLGGNITTTASTPAITDSIGLNMILNGNRTITTNANHNLAISGIISQDATNRSVTKAGDGTLTLSGANTYAGGTTINAGTLRAGAASASDAVGPLGAITTGLTLANASGALLDVNGFDVRVRTVTGGGAAGGNITLGSGGTLRVTDPSFGGFYSGVISGAGNVSLTGSSGLNFSGANTYTGTTTISTNVTLGLNHVNVLGTNPGISGTSQIIFNNSGQLRPRLSGVVINAPITVNANSNAQIQGPDNSAGNGVTTTLTLNGTIGGPGNVNFYTNNNATTLSTVILGAASNYAGTTTLGAGGGTSSQIIVKLGVANALPTTTVLTIDGGNGTGTPGTVAEINLNGFNQTLAGLTNNNTRTNRRQRVVNSNVSTAATLTINNSADYTFSGSLGSNAADGSVSTAAMGALSTRGNNFGLIKSGLGAIVLAGDNTFAGSLNIQNGIVKAGKNSTSGSVGPFGDTNSAAIILTNIATAGLDINGFNVSVKDLQGGGAAGGTVNLTTGNTLSILNPSSGSSFYNGLITGGGNLLVNGSSRQTINGAHSYTGTTTLTGTVSLRVNSLADGGNNSGIGAAGTAASNLVLNSGIFEYNSTLSGSTNRLFTLGGNVTIQTNGTGAMNFTGTGSIAHSTVAAKTLTLTTSSSGSGTMAPIITDSGTGANITSLTKNGANTWTLAGANTYSGNTTVNAGTLVLADNAQLKFVLGATSGSNNRISGAGTVTLDGDFVIDTTAADALASGSWTLENVSSLSGAYGATFTVVGFTNAGDNKWTKVNGAKLYTFDETTGILTLAPNSPYDTWATLKGLTDLNKAQNLDPDNDGRNNLAEFAFDGDPLSGAGNGLVFFLTEDSDIDVDTAKELILTVAVRTGTPAFTGSPSPSATQTADGITYTIEGSLDLAGFPATVNALSIPITTALPPAGTGYEYRSFSLEGSNGLTGKGFLRAKVTSP